MKCEASQELVVGGFTDPQRSRVGLGALLVGYYEGDDFVFAGKVGTGFDTKLLRDLRAAAGCASRSPSRRSRRAVGLPRVRAHWVRPELVVQVAFIEWTVHGKLRHPRLLGIRTDKSPRDVVRETCVITHPEKVLFPDDGITKGELAAYYEAIAPLMLPHLRGPPDHDGALIRPASARRGSSRRTSRKGFPEWLERVEVPKKGGTVHHPLVTDVRSLLWLANQNSITPHVWTSRVPDLRHPDLCVFDLDPAIEDAERAAGPRHWPCAICCRSSDLQSWVKTSGSKGFHIVVPLEAGTSFREVARFADRVGARAREAPSRSADAGVQQESIGRAAFCIDTGRNGYSATFAAAYAVRPETGAPVSAPCTLGGSRERRGRSGDVHAEDDGEARR